MSDETEIKNAKTRLFAGACLGFTISFIACLVIMHFRGVSDVDLNPYCGAPPIMSALLFGFMGAVIGSLLSLFSRKWNKYQIEKE